MKYFLDTEYCHVPNVIWPNPETQEYCHSTMILDPYGGCEHNCMYCYVKMGRARIHQQDLSNAIQIRKTIPVKFESFLKKYSKIRFPIRLSSNSDPFQPSETHYRLSRMIIELCAKFEYPIIINTKIGIPKSYLSTIQTLNEKSLVAVQLSMTSLNPKIEKILNPRINQKKRYEFIENMRIKNIPLIIRYQPIIPYINSSDEEIFKLINLYQDSTIDHVICGFIRIRWSELNKMINLTRFSSLLEKKQLQNFSNREWWIQDNIYYHPNITFRRNVLNVIKKECIRNRLNFTVCKEPFQEMNTIKDCCGGIFSNYHNNWDEKNIGMLPKRIRNMFEIYPRIFEISRI